MAPACQRQRQLSHRSRQARQAPSPAPRSFVAGAAASRRSPHIRAVVSDAARPASPRSPIPLAWSSRC